MIFSKKTHDGEIFLDHSNSPGIPAELAVKLGYHPDQVKEGAQFRCATLGCKHCGLAQVRNPWRTRERAWCSICDVYICDGCDYLRKQPGYVHHTIDDLKDLAASGKLTIIGD